MQDFLFVSNEPPDVLMGYITGSRILGVSIRAGLCTCVITDFVLITKVCLN